MSTRESTMPDPAGEKPCDCIYCMINRLVADHLRHGDTNPMALVEVCLALGFVQADLAAAAPLEDAKRLVASVISKGAASRAQQIANGATPAAPPRPGAVH